MDAHSRGRADDIDPADQWVLNPNTGNYELRLDHSAGESSSPSRTATAEGTGRRGSTRTDTSREGSGRRGTREGGADGPRREVPGQRSRRASQSGGRGTEPPASGRRKRKPKKSRKKKALLWTGGVVAFVVVATSIGAYAVYQKLNGNIDTIDVGDAGSKNVLGEGPMNILIIGTDKRTGKGNEGYGDKGSEGHADTTILFHVSEDRTNATAMSIPRDLMTEIPECETKQSDGTTTTIPGTPNERFNTSLGQSGRNPGCTMKTVENITGLMPDHFMMVDFNAVKELTTAVGGVKVCMAKPVDDPKSHLKLPAGESEVAGEQALALLRTRHSFGNESDLDRIKVQQQFLASMIREMKSSDTLTNPKKLYTLADAATNALTVDTGIGDAKKLMTLAQEIGKVDTKNVTFLTMPVIDNPAEPKPITVVVDPVKGEQLFAMMRSDTSLTEVKQKEKAAKGKQAALLKGPKAEPADVRVDVLNGGEIAGAAGSTVTWLQNEQGVLKSTNKANAPEKIKKTTLEYAPNQADQARALAAMMGLPATAMKKGTADAEGLEAMVLTLGADFKGAGQLITGPAKAPEGVEQASADKAVCAK
ncbi:LCP family protein [Streptomyces sp. NRRL_ISP-5395]|uniref:LCP family protein n=1 Tax=Streptomyces TaxID=1883 RepID=UPI00198BB412|nr:MULTISPECIES: LCP family protein [Streptomyces]MDX2672263.1 LCP family protein [Streptomyces sp. NRRL_ISP-5395]GHF55135.1 LytR family transcriptional regulator [Streptomyces griseus]